MKQNENADSCYESIGPTFEQIPESLVSYYFRGMLGGVVWSLCIATVLVGLRIAAVSLSADSLISMADLLIPFMIVPVWGVIAGMVGLARECKRRRELSSSDFRDP